MLHEILLNQIWCEGEWEFLWGIHFLLWQHLEENCYEVNFVIWLFIYIKYLLLILNWELQTLWILTGGNKWPSYTLNSSMHEGYSRREKDYTWLKLFEYIQPAHQPIAESRCTYIWTQISPITYVTFVKMYLTPPNKPILALATYGPQKSDSKIMRLHKNNDNYQPNRLCLNINYITDSGYVRMITKRVVDACSITKASGRTSRN
jgi:hypothetical protein